MRAEIRAAGRVDLTLSLRVLPYEKSLGEAEMGDLGFGREDKKDSSSKYNTRSMAGRSRETLEAIADTEGGAG